MSLLPKSHFEFGSKSYWESFFSKRKDAFEWYGSYNDLCGVIHKYCKVSDEILMVGCGNSTLSQEMYDTGQTNITNIDISDVAIKKMISQNENKRPDMKFINMDVKKMSFTDNRFNVVIDKGTLDAIFTDSSAKPDVNKMFSEIDRVLKFGGRYICISLAQNHILEELLNYFTDWYCIRLHHIEITDDSSNNGGLGKKLPVFAFILTKMKMKLKQPFLELVPHDTPTSRKFTSIDELKDAVTNLQDFAMLQHKLKSNSLSSEELTFGLWSNDSNIVEPRYTFTMVNVDKSELDNMFHGSYAVFIAPNGQENEPTYSTKSGRENLAKFSGFTCLVIVKLHRGHSYTDLESVKSELSPTVFKLTPANCDPLKTPFLMPRADLGYRNVLYNDVIHESNGRFIVEDVLSSDLSYKRLFVNHHNGNDEILCSCRLKKEKQKKKSKKRICDYRYIEAIHHKFIYAVLYNNVFSKQETVSVLLVGFRNFPLAQFIVDIHSKVKLYLIEDSEYIMKIESDYFSPPNMNDDLEVKIEDTRQFITKEKGDTVEEYDVIIVDVSNSNWYKDVSFTSMKHHLKDSGLLFLYDSFNEDQKSKLKTEFPFCYRSEFPDKYLLVCGSDDMTEINKMDSLQIFLNETRPGVYEKNVWDIETDFVNIT